MLKHIQISKEINREREREREDKMLIGVMAEFFPSSHYPSLLINFFMQDAEN